MKTIAITSGKGGVGKTNISANLSIALAERGSRIVVFDADIGLANLDVVFGVPVTSTLQNVLSGERRLDEVLHAAHEGVRFVPGGSGVESLLSLNTRQSEMFLESLQELAINTDYLIFDTGAGLSENVFGFLKAADEVFVVVTPDPSSITDGYATIKALVQDDSKVVIRVIMNMVSNETEGLKVFEHLKNVVNRFLSYRIGYLGSIRMDPMAVANIRKRVPFVVGSPRCAAAYDIGRVATKITGMPLEQEATDILGRIRGLLRLPPRKIA